MKYLRKYSLFLFLITCHKLIFAQQGNTEPRERGIYRTFDEYLNNHPSVKDSFLVTYFTRSKTDSAVISAKYDQPDGTPFIDPMWGFCDGTNVFVRYPKNLFNVDYCWKIDHVGQFSYFTQIQKSGTSFGPAILTKVISAAVTTALAPKDLVTQLIDNKGNVRYLDEDQLKKYLKPYPDLLASFKNDLNKAFPEEIYDSEHFFTDEEYAKKEEFLKEYLLKLDKAKSASVKEGL